MKQITLIFLSFILLACNGQSQKTAQVVLTVSPIIDQEHSDNSIIISTLKRFLKTKNNSLSANEYWLQADFKKYIHPYLDIYAIEQSRYGKDFFRPTLMEILPTDTENKKILKIAYLGYHPETDENFIKMIYNIIATVDHKKVVFSRYLDYVTKDWTPHKTGSIAYIISPNKKVNTEEISQQKQDIDRLCHFFQTTPIAITYYSCIHPKELFEIKGFDYNLMMYVDSSGGLADHGNIIFSGNNAEIYTHEIIHIYTQQLFPNINKFLDEGIATYLAGSGIYDYAWHRKKLAQFITANPEYDFNTHFDPYERLYFEGETSIPYLTAALICERTIRKYGKERLLKILKSEDEIWLTLQRLGLTKENINTQLREELQLTPTLVWS